MKKVIIAVVLLVVVAAAGVLGYWHWRRNQGRRLLIRADVALRAEQPSKALDLASRYTIQRPKDYLGHQIVGQAHLRLGNTDAAETALKQAVKLAGDDERTPRLLLAGCHAHRAERLLGTRADTPSEEEIRSAIAQFSQANEVLRTDGNAPPPIEYVQRRGLNLERIGTAYLRLARNCRRQAREAAAAKADTREKEMLAAAETASRRGDQAHAKAIEVLLDVCRRKPGREKPAQSLVRLTGRPTQSEWRDEVRTVILEADDKPPVAAANLIMADLAAGKTIDPEETAQASRILDELLTKAPDASEVALARAQLALVQGDAEIARKLAESVLKQNDRHAAARLVRARALLQMGETEAAEESLFALKAESPRWAEAHYLYALAARASGKSELAQEAMRTVTRLQPGHPQASRFLAEYLLKKGFEDQALVDARKWHQAQPGSPGALLMYVRTLRANERARQAGQVLAEARTRHADEPVMLMAVADGYDIVGNEQAARKAAEQASALEGETWRERLAVARAAIQSGQASRADSLMSELLDRHPKRDAVRFEAARLYARTGRKTQALEQARKAVSLQPNEPLYRLMLAKLLMESGQVAEAHEQCREILASHPDHAEASLLANQAAIVLGDRATDLPAIPVTGGSRVQLALTHLRAGQPEKASTLCQAELSDDPDDLAARSVLGEALLAMEKYDLAQGAYERVLASGSAGLSAYLRVAQILSRHSDPQQVEQTMLSLDGTSAPLVHLTMGRVHLAAGNFEAAAESLAAVAQQRSAPEHIRFRAGLLRARTLAMSGERTAALDQLDELAKTANRTAALLTKSSLLMTMGRTQQADAILAGLRSQALGEKDTSLLGQLVRIYLQRGEHRRALELSTALAEITRDAWATHADVLRVAGRPKEAETWYRKAIAARPGELATPLRLADLLARQHRFPDVLEVLRRMAGRSTTARLLSLQMRARYYAEWGLPGEALRCIEELDKLSAVSNPRLELTKAGAFASLGNVDRAREILQAVPTHSPVHLRARQMLVSLADDAPSKHDLLSELAEEYPDDASVLLQRMVLLLEAGEYDKAADLYDGFRKRAGRAALSPRLAEAGLRAKVRASRMDEAFRLAVEAAGASRQPHWTLRAMLLGDPDDVEELDLPRQPAVELMRHALRLVKVAGEKRWDAVTKHHDGLAGVLDAGSDALPANAQWMKLLAEIAAGKVIDARQSLTEGFAGALVLRVAADELVSHAEKEGAARREAGRALRAVVARRLGMPYLAERIAADVLKARPRAQWAAATVAQVNPDRRKEVLDALKPADTTLAGLLRADRLLADGSFAEAAEAYRNLLEDQPADWELQQRLAIALERSGGREEALELYKKVWNIAASPTAANNAAYLVSQLHPSDQAQLKAAVSRVEKAIERTGRLASFLDTKGWLLHLQGDANAAVPLLREAIRGAGNSAEIHYHLAVVEDALGNEELAAMHYRSAVDAVAAARKEGEVVEPADAEAARLAEKALGARKKEAA